jgi:cytochrome P450
MHGMIVKAPGAIPVIGHMRQLFNSPQEFIRSLPAHGDLVRIRVGLFDAIVVCSFELTKQVLADPETFDKGGPIYDRLREILGNTLITSDFAGHPRQRRLIQPVFHRKRFPGYADAMTEQIASVLDEWHDGQEIEPVSDMLNITSRIAIATLFAAASESISQRIRRIVDDWQIIIEGLSRDSILPTPLNRIPTLANRRYRRANARLRQVFKEIIEEYRKDEIDHGDLLSVLMAARDDSNGSQTAPELSDLEINDQVMSFFVAGLDTTANVLASALFFLTEHPEIEERLHTEVDAVLNGSIATFADLPKLELTERIITETLRLAPPAWIITRITTRETVLGGYPIRKGKTLIYSPYLIHQDPALFNEPQSFDPDRWCPGANKQPPRGSHIPFGAGPRKCVGANFGVTEATLALASIAVRWQLSMIEGVKPSLSHGITLAPQNFRVRISARSTTLPTRLPDLT